MVPLRDVYATSSSSGGGGSGGNQTAEPMHSSSSCSSGALAQFCFVAALSHLVTRSAIDKAYSDTEDYIADGFRDHRRDFILGEFWENMVLASFKAMVSETTSMSLAQVMMAGAYFDAKQQMSVQRLFQTKIAQAHKDYFPSTGMCVMGTMAQGLAAASRNAENTAFVMSERALERNLNNASSNAALGEGDDKSSRFSLFKSRHCDPRHGDGQFVALCGSTPPEGFDRDVDYTATFEYPYTLDINLFDASVTGAEMDLWGFANNLYGHEVFTPIPPSYFSLGDNQREYLNLRSVVAKRSVAENSFNALVSMKVAGPPTPSGENYVHAVLTQLGLSTDEAMHIVGERPSYYAAMEVLSKKIYQDPEFYTDLYDKPVNVDRKIAAMRSIGLMQDMDIFKSKLRNEMLLSMILEARLDDAQQDLQGRLDVLPSGGKR